MIWLKAFHIVFMVTWFACLFYLPRLFVNHVTIADNAGRERFKAMERKLFVMMTIGGTLTVIFGLAMIVTTPALLDATWLRVKLCFVALLVGYHIWCYRLLVAFREDRNAHSDRWYRIFNEAPSLLLIAIVILAVVKPF
jgi:protoporphyrinogen IX oxidase